MKSKHVKITVIALCAVLFALVLLVSAFSGFRKEAPEVTNEGTAAFETAVTTPFVTLEADGRQITVEDTAGKTVQQLLDQARIQMSENDLLVISPSQLLDGTLTIQVLRQTAQPTLPESTLPAATEPEPTAPETTRPEATESDSSEEERTIVSVEVYEDCDGSGHGVKVIKYSDGTQEEVYF